MVEAFIRDDVMTFLLKSTAEKMNESDKSGFVEPDDILVDDQQLFDHFGKLYAQQPANFRFLPGDRMLIKELVSHVAGIVDANGINSGLSKFRTKKTMKTNHTAKHSAQNTTRNSSLNNIDPEKLKSELIQRITSCMYSHGANHEFDIDLENEIHEDVVNVHIMKGFVRGTVRCIICDKENRSKNKPKRVHYSSGSNWPCWVLSNFAKHLKTAHHLKFHEIETKLDEKNGVPRSGIDESVVVLDGSIQNIQNAGNSTQNPELITTLYTQLSNQITLMMSVVLKNSESQQNMFFKLVNDVLPANAGPSLTVAIIAGNGNCLYSALAHQLENKRINSKGHQRTSDKLREDVVEYILENYSKFSHQLRDRVYDLKKTEQIDNIDTECKLFVRLVLSKDGTWGGAETIHAVSELKQVNIVLFNENGPCYMLSNINMKYSRTICIAYRQAHNAKGELIKDVRNHYDSVCDVSSTILYDAVQIITNNQK